MLVLLLISRTSTSFAAPKPDLWPRWTAHDISTYNRAEQFACRVKLYNALTIDAVLEH